MDVPLQAFFLLSLGVFGLVFGSFANVVIWRLPRDESLVAPGSHCPRCGTPIRPYDNVPIVSWLLLRGRCRDCAEPISWRYPAVEATSGVLWIAAGVRFGATPRTAVAIVLFYLLLILAFIDLDTMRLPNVLVGVLAIVGLAGVVVAQLTGAPLVPLLQLPLPGRLGSPVFSALLGVLLGVVPLGLLAVAYRGIRRRRGLGAGDLKLLAAAGLYLGPYVLVSLFIGSLLGLVGGIALSVEHGAGTMGTRRFPFGPFLAAGIVAAVLAGPAVVVWYLTLVR